MLGGATASEVAFFVLLLCLVLLATKAGRIGEAVGRLFAKPDPRRRGRRP